MSCKNILLDNIKNNTRFTWKIWSKRVKELQDYSRLGKKLVLFGAGAMGEKCSAYLERLNIQVDELWDNDTKKQGIFETAAGNKIACCSPRKLEQDTLCIITTGSKHFASIKKQLTGLGIDNVMANRYIDYFLEVLVMIYETGIDEFCTSLDELFDYFMDDNSYIVLWLHFKNLFQIEDVPEEYKDITFESVCEKPQYFLENGECLGKQKTMIDCGAYIGDTLEDLIKNIKYEDFEEYVAFEMDEINYNKLTETISSLPQSIQDRIFSFQLGVGDCHQFISYISNDGRTVAGINGKNSAEIVKLDDACKDKKISFIKMDIEGSELRALAGAKNIIEKEKPMCAICIYHNVVDFWRIPQILKQFVPDYQLKLVHHGPLWAETVCYAKAE